MTNAHYLLAKARSAYVEPVMTEYQITWFLDGLEDAYEAAASAWAMSAKTLPRQTNSSAGIRTLRHGNR